jgi:hypothetical protein
MTLDLPRERCRYRPAMPEAAWRRGIRPPERIRRWRAMLDLADGLERYLRRPGIRGDRTEWAAWALKLGATVPATPAPDGSLWYVQTVHE